MNKLKGQFSTEFLILLSLVLLLFVISILIYSMNSREADAIADAMDANQLCIRVSSSISSFASLKGNSTFTFSLPTHLNYKNYSIWIKADSKIVKINYKTAGMGCKLQTLNISHSNGSTFFELDKNATVRNTNGVLTID